jgi:hypothetical protein
MGEGMSKRGSRDIEAQSLEGVHIGMVLSHGLRCGATYIPEHVEAVRCRAVVGERG